MALTNAGAILIASAVLGDGGVSLLTNANMYIGLGDSNTAFSASQTDLQASSNKVRKPMASGSYPSRSSNVITAQSNFGTSDANFAINEFGTFNASTAGTMFTRKVDATLGTKTSAQSWVVTVTLTVQAA